MGRDQVSLEAQTTRRESIKGLRVGMFQAVIPHYRTEVFNQLARQCEELTIFHCGRGTQEGFHRGESGTGYLERLVKLRKVGPLHWMPALSHEVDPSRFDVLIYPWNVHLAHLVPGIKKSQRCGVGTVLWGHGYAHRLDSWLRKAMRHRPARLAHVLLTYNQYARDNLVSEGFDPQRIHVAHNALDQSLIQAARSRWLADPDRLKSFEREHQLDERPVALFVSRLVSVQRLEALLCAWREVVRRLPESVLVIIGDGAARGPLQARCHEYGITEQVRFTGAIYNEDELAPWYLSSRVFAFPQSIGLSIHSAFGFGLPVVTFDCPRRHGPEFEILKSGTNGIAVRDGDMEALVEALCRLLADATLASGFGAAARETVLGEFTLDRMLDGFTAAIAHASRLAR